MSLVPKKKGRPPKAAPPVESGKPPMIIQSGPVIGKAEQAVEIRPPPKPTGVTGTPVTPVKPGAAAPGVAPKAVEIQVQQIHLDPQQISAIIKDIGQWFKAIGAEPISDAEAAYLGTLLSAGVIIESKPIVIPLELGLGVGLLAIIGSRVPNIVDYLKGRTTEKVAEEKAKTVLGEVRTGAESQSRTEMAKGLSKVKEKYGL